MPESPLLSVCMIARDEERWLPRSLASVAPHADEIVLVDTGSRDRSLDIARQFGARIIERPWRADFALHRNQALEAARGQWILVLDADEELEQGGASHLRGILQRPEAAQADALFIEILHLAADGGHGLQILPRLFRNFAGIRFTGRIHERLTGGNGRALRAPIRLIHHGFAQAPPVLAAKAARNLGLIRAWIEEEPENHAAWAYLAQTQMARAETAPEALAAGQKALALARAQGAPPRFLPRVYHPMLIALTVLGRRQELVGLAEQCLDELPGYPDPLYSLAWAAYVEGRWDAVCAWAEQFVGWQEHWRARILEYPYEDNLTLSLAPRVLAWWAVSAARLGRAEQARSALARLEREEGGAQAARELRGELARAGLAGLGEAPEAGEGHV